MAVLLEVGGFDIGGGVMTLAQAHINVQKHYFRGGVVVPNELDGIAAVP